MSKMRQNWQKKRSRSRSRSRDNNHHKSIPKNIKQKQVIKNPIFNESVFIFIFDLDETLFSPCRDKSIECIRHILSEEQFDELHHIYKFIEYKYDDTFQDIPYTPNGCGFLRQGLGKLKQFIKDMKVYYPERCLFVIASKGKQNSVYNIVRKMNLNIDVILGRESWTSKNKKKYSDVIDTLCKKYQKNKNKLKQIKYTKNHNVIILDDRIDTWEIDVIVESFNVRKIKPFDIMSEVKKIYIQPNSIKNNNNNDNNNNKNTTNLVYNKKYNQDKYLTYTLNYYYSSYLEIVPSSRNAINSQKRKRDSKNGEKDNEANSNNFVIIEKQIIKQQKGDNKVVMGQSIGH